MKKYISLMLTLTLMMPILAPISAVNAADDEVCGIDNVTYDSLEAAETAGVEVSYDFACTNSASEEGLYEETTEISFAGMLIEIGSTDLPTTIIVRDNKDGQDYTIEVDVDTILGLREGVEVELSDWIPGDQIKVKGARNENTENIEASSLVNLSFSLRNNEGINGWITNISSSTNEITYQWANVEHTFRYSDDTRFVVGGINPASVSDLEVNDRIRGRLVNSEAKIIIVLRRGEDLFMKIRTFRPNAELVRLDSTIVPTTIQVRILPTPGLSSGDVNNLIGADGTLVTINVTEDTKLVRKYFGKTGLDGFSVGDNLKIVGRVNDDGTVDAKLLKNNSIWQTSLQGHAGVVTEVNSEESYLMVNWTPVKHATKKMLRSALDADDETVTAQMVGAKNPNMRGAVPTLLARGKQDKTFKERAIEKVKQFKAETIGVIKRQIQVKKVQIERIKHENVKMKDLIQRMPVKKMKVEIGENATITIAGNENATIADIKAGDKVRVRGTRHASLPLITAQTITVVSSLPEVEEDLETEIDDVNEVVEEFVGEDEDGETETEEVISDEDGEEGNTEEEGEDGSEEEDVTEDDEEEGTEDEDATEDDEESNTDEDGAEDEEGTEDDGEEGDTDDEDGSEDDESDDGEDDTSDDEDTATTTPDTTS